ncbi:TPA: helix-turn-helix domain-containing protein [Streptococcus suis]
MTRDYFMETSVDKNKLKQYFPTASLADSPQKREGMASLSLGERFFLNLELNSLTDRERYLLELLQENQDNIPRAPWQDFFDGQGPMPTSVGQLQVLQIKLWSNPSEEVVQAWLEFMETLLPNLVSHYASASDYFVFIMDQRPFIDYQEILRDTIGVMEYDFGIKMTAFLGQIWPGQVQEWWPDAIRAEMDLFRSWMQKNLSASFLTFSQLFFLDEAKDKAVMRILSDMIAKHEMEDVIRALWDNGAVLTKAAQSLFVHRNTLLYRLDKWFELTGLQLRELTDLALLYYIVESQVLG